MSNRESETLDENDITVKKSTRRPSDVWLFFDGIRDVNDLSPAEEQMEAWEAVIDGKTVGMGVVNTMPNPSFIRRVAVQEHVRESGIGSQLIECIKTIHSDVACRVHQSNCKGEALVTSTGFVATESRFHKLDRYETNPG